MKMLEHDPLITKRQLADYLQVHPRTITRLVAEKRIPCIKVGKSSVRFRLADVLDALEGKEE